MLMIEVFKTNITERKAADKIVEQLGKLLPGSHVNFDLEDCDKVLRVECDWVDIEKVVEYLNEMGHWCEVLDWLKRTD